MTLKTIKTIALCSTARFAEENVITLAEQWLKKHNFNIVHASNLHLKYHQFGGNDQDRSQAFQQLIDDPNVDAIWCIRGGYGTVRVMEHLDWTAFKQNPKLLMGFSDFTILLNHVLQFNTISLHAPMPIQLNTLESSCLKRLYELIQNQYSPITWTDNTNSSSISCQGKLVGGNLSMLYSFMGSNSYPKTQNSILFIEDLDEYSYHLDRMMYGLRRSGSLDGIKAILVGRFTDIHDHDTPFGESYKDIFIKFAKTLNIPIYFNFPAGHVDNNQPIALGKEVSISFQEDDTYTLTYNG